MFVDPSPPMAALLLFSSWRGFPNLPFHRLRGRLHCQQIWKSALHENDARRVKTTHMREKSRADLHFRVESGQSFFALRGKLAKIS